MASRALQANVSARAIEKYSHMPSIGVLEHNQNPSNRPSKRIKRADGQTQVRRGAAVWIIKNVLLQLLPPHTQAHKGPMQYTPSTRSNEPAEPSQSPRTGKLRWEPPKNKRDLKAHPWAGIVVNRIAAEVRA